MISQDDPVEYALLGAGLIVYGVAVAGAVFAASMALHRVIRKGRP